MAPPTATTDASSPDRRARSRWRRDGGCTLPLVAGAILAFLAASGDELLRAAHSGIHGGVGANLAVLATMLLAAGLTRLAPRVRPPGSPERSGPGAGGSPGVVLGPEASETDRETPDLAELLAALSAYVPASIVARLAHGLSVECGEREVSVLFVDLSDYSAYVQRQCPEETFSFLSRYTDGVSRVVRRHGGTIVEFGGDGMMALFGAPDELAGKERAAVLAALEFASELEPGLIPSGSAPGPRIRVGIATGNAFVGSLRSADHLIWSAIGHTTNRASRLQGLARQLGASIVIDAATWAAAQPLRRGFRLHRSLDLRGLDGHFDVHALPLASPRVGRWTSPQRVGSPGPLAV
jgi:adenylate cyclase